jgi:hypothetical protein
MRRSTRSRGRTTIGRVTPQARCFQTGPLAGVPFLLKDLGALWSGTTSTGSNKFLAGMRFDHDSSIVDRYLAAGLNIFGRFASPELVSRLPPSRLGDPYWPPPPAGPFLDEVGRPPGTLRIALCT